MKIDEFGVGNYLKSIHTNGFIVVDLFLFSEINEDETYIDSLQPIELTRGWLLELGFKRDLDLEKLEDGPLEQFYFGDNTTSRFIRICWHKVGGFTLSYQGAPLVKVKYIHKLQNICYELIEIKLVRSDGSQN